MDSPKKLPVDPSLENLRKQAKQLLRGYQDGSPEAVTRVGRVFTEKPVKLADAQHVVAVEYGFASWPKLIEYLTSIGA
ncbi:MAG: ankyrin repeat domain-containing protein, partial [Planctomycetota bacterium]